MRLRAHYTPVWECIECGARFTQFPDMSRGEFCCGTPGTRVVMAYEEATDATHVDGEVLDQGPDGLSSGLLGMDGGEDEHRLRSAG